MVKTFPLVRRGQNEVIAYLLKPIANFGLAAGKVDVNTFLSHVRAVAAALGEGKHAINMCDNRYLFLVSFCAVVLRRHINLLPATKNTFTQHQLNEAYADTYIIHDGVDIATPIPSIDLRKLTLNNAHDSSLGIPQIPNKHLACITFTSGSTGQSKPILKYWRTLHCSTAINYRYMIPKTDNTIFQLATMPAQHMWGLETSILMPLFENVCMSDVKPLFPQDIFDSLRSLPAPRLLVSTPIHLRAISVGSADDLSLHAVLCATSPLAPDLAQEIELKFAAPLLEVYGCSEVGSMAVRETARERNWLRFDDIHFEKDGEDTVVSAKHLPESTLLQDNIDIIDEQHFTLRGRTTDLVKIAGKRGSLFEINQVLLQFKGLVDGIVIFPNTNNAITRLCAIVALKPGYDKLTLRRFLREHLDSAFVPRPIHVVDTLPRESNGKLLKTRVEDLLKSLKK